MESFNITFIGEDGQYKLNDCKMFPTKEQIEEMFDALVDCVGQVTRIVIDNIK